LVPLCVDVVQRAEGEKRPHSVVQFRGRSGRYLNKQVDGHEYGKDGKGKCGQDDRSQGGHVPDRPLVDGEHGQR